MVRLAVVDPDRRGHPDRNLEGAEADPLDPLPLVAMAEGPLHGTPQVAFLDPVEGGAEGLLDGTFLK